MYYFGLGAALGAVLQQHSQEGWETIYFAFRFFTEFEKKYSIEELQLLALIRFIL